MLQNPQKSEFQRALLDWFHIAKRDLPWRRTRDPYAIWLSEIMLQQTRVAAVIPFYQRFLARFPDFQTLAAAPESELLAHWAGLGYYYRARNLQKAALTMCEHGSFPSNYDSIRALPGVGDYTSAAVASIAFNLPFAVLDGNVFRVLSRVFADPTDIASPAGRKHFSALAQQLLLREQPGPFNQAMMELGATLCLPKNPHCLVCPVSQSCRARQSSRQNEFPVKLGRVRSVEEERVLFWVEQEGQLLVWQRPADSRLMPGFWELPETKQLPALRPGGKVGAFRHGITVYRYRFDVHRAVPPPDLGCCVWVRLDALAALPASTILRKAQRLVARQVVAQHSRVAVAANR